MASRQHRRDALGTHEKGKCPIVDGYHTPRLHKARRDQIDVRLAETAAEQETTMPNNPTLAQTDDANNDTPLRRSMLDSADRLAKGLPASAVVYPGQYSHVVTDWRTNRVFALCGSPEEAEEICCNTPGSRLMWEPLGPGGLVTRAEYDRYSRAVSGEV